MKKCHLVLFLVTEVTNEEEPSGLFLVAEVTSEEEPPGCWLPMKNSCLVLFPIAEWRDEVAMSN